MTDFAERQICVEIGFRLRRAHFIEKVGKGDSAVAQPTLERA
jgi:hypothetical protein